MGIIGHFFAFAASKGYLGPWKRIKREHTLQTDSISCGIFTAVFAEIFLEGKEEYLACPSVEQERERLGLLLFNSLDKSGICGICHQSVSVKNKGRCSSCFANIHTKCLPGSQEDSRCLFCKGGFLVESALKVSDFHQAKRYQVTSEELRRRCSPPESYSVNTVVAYLRKAKGQKKTIEEKLTEMEVKPSKRTKLTSQCSKLCEDECSDLAGDIMYLAAKFIPKEKVGRALLEDGNVHAAMAKIEDCRSLIN
ncbi:uncharacterized protein LOC125727571 [Brienomyrus brachyistius]|uniref:uncharacterized protein LOC125727571 n=1 Tax=Brienomyrus brachyistius TaxID=42636 RepID=UPI0020B2F470|nr:uncharacterized protein LOC125727571 [Brienomyrus brachyistius]